MIMEKIILEVKNLQKAYGGLKAVDGVSFEVRQGEKFVFVGPNGAGKSTTINIISTLLSKDDGEVRYQDLLLGQDDDAIRRQIGVVFQNHVLDEDLTVRENLLTRGALYAQPYSQVVEQAGKLEKQLELGGFINQPYGQLSGGQKRRSDIARALMNTPSILILDEPTTGLDPQTRRMVWEIINQIRKDLGMTVFLTTHYMEETEDADSVVIIDNGKIVARGTPHDLKARYAPMILKLYARDPLPLQERLRQAGHDVKIVSDSLILPMRDSFEAAALAAENRDLVNTFELLNGSMDDVFIAITGKKIRE